MSPDQVKETIKALRAICEGYEQKPSEGYVVVVNPDATPEALALGGVDVNLVIDCQQLITHLETHTKTVYYRRKN